MASTLTFIRIRAAGVFGALPYCASGMPCYVYERPVT